MDSHYIEYTFDDNAFRVSKTELYSVLSSTGECLSPAFNMQVQILIQVIEISEAGLKLDELQPLELAHLNQHFPGVTLDTLRSAVKAYHAYAMNMYYI